MNGDNARAISILRTIRNIALDVGSSIGTTKESVIEAMGMAISSLDRPTPAPGALPELPEPIGHVHSDYEYCADKPFKNDGWPVSVYDEHQMQAYARAYAEQCRAGVWLPIETAPKDGSTFIVWSPDYRDPETVWWDDGWVYNWHEYDGYSRMDNVTHWMPLPAPPAIQSAFADDEGVR